MPWERLIQFLAHDLTQDQVRAVIRVGLRAVFGFHILFACGWLTVFGLSGFARAADTEGLRTSIAALRDDFSRAQAQDKVDKLEDRLAAIDQEIFAIEAKLAEIGRLGQHADVLYGQRLTTLRSEHAAVTRQLAEALDHPALLPPGKPRS